MAAQQNPNARTFGESQTPITQHGSATAAVILLFALVFGFLAIGSFSQQSPTIDEPIHLLAGYSYLRWGDYRINPEHPPLAKAWAALPLLWLKIDDPRSPATQASQSFSGEPGDRFYSLAHDMFFVRNDATTLFFYAKLQMVLVAALLGLLIYLWSRELFGFTAAVISLFVFALDPNILAHSGIVHTDLPFAAIYFIGTYFVWRLLQRFNSLNLAATSICLGVAVITKYAYVWILPAWLILALIKIFSAEPLEVRIGSARLITSRWKKAGVSAACFLCCAIVAYAILWSAYGFRFAAAIGDGQSFRFDPVVSESVYGAKLIPLLTHYRLFPEAWIYGHFYVLSELARNMYFFGEVSNRGFWTYFPVAFLVKTPLPTIVLLIASIWLWVRNRQNRLPAILLLVAGIYFCGAMVARLNIGLRHILPVYPFLFVVIGGTIVQLWRAGSRINRGGLIVLGFWYICSTLFAYPHYLAYFNELIGGPKNGHKALLDSNLDWGQDLKGLKKWMDENAVKKIQLFYFGAAAPKYYGIDDFYSTDNLFGSAARGEIDLPEHLAISANFLYGGELFLPKDVAELLASYGLGQPVATLGYSILVYKLNRADPRVYENAAVLSARKGALERAQLLLERALQIDSTSANGYFQMGRVSAQRGEWEDAAENFRKAVKIDPQLAEGYYNLGRILIAQGRVDQAIENFRQTVHLKPNHADAHHSLAQALARQGKVDEAAQHYQEALRILKTGAGRSAVK